MKLKQYNIIIFTLCLLLIPKNAFAYLDPGTGSMLLSVIIGLLSTCYFALRKLPLLIRTVLFRIAGKKELLQKHSVVFYCESPAYWNTFKPLLEEFGKRDTPILYLTSAEKDPCFSAGLPSCIQCSYIGKGNKAYTKLNFIEADVFCLTTPGVDVLQIRRSKGVKKYVHVLHAPTDIHIYKYFSFDYYDAVLCNGEHQIFSLRMLEEKRHTKPKYLPVAGCPYYDVQMKRYEAEGIKSQSPDPNTVLFAPTWGKNGTFQRSGSKIPEILAKAGFNVIIRPHPQSLVSEPELLNKIQKELSSYSNVVWDKEPDGFPSMAKASIMVSDMSGVICDFAFIFLKPVVTLDFDFQNKSFEAFDLPHDSWIFTILNILGKRLNKDEEKLLPEVLHKLIGDSSRQDQIRILREKSIANFGNCAGFLCDEILKIQQEAQKEEDHA